jgi:hypothetical protein
MITASTGGRYNKINWVARKIVPAATNAFEPSLIRRSGRSARSTKATRQVKNSVRSMR